ncbi:MAG: hypothetical protein KJ732_00680, partial [Candidatus Margulisbacteria bacterium]|nr:hypothetical protein [Candidatus Margulisiibacteriota bacterium]
ATTTTTTITPTTTTIPTITLDKSAKRTEFMGSIGIAKSFRLTGKNIPDNIDIKLVKGDQVIQATDIKVINGQVTYYIVVPPKDTAMTTVGDWDLHVTLDGSTTIQPAAVRFEFPGGLYFYPTKTSSSALKASASASQPRIAYTLSADQPIQLIIYDVVNMRPIFHRTFAAGQTGGKVGYNEYIWDGTTDSGTTISNGSYVLQGFSNGKLIGQTYFVVID